MVATNVSHWRLCDDAVSNAGVASMIPASQAAVRTQPLDAREVRLSPVRVRLVHIVGNSLCYR